MNPVVRRTLAATAAGIAFALAGCAPAAPVAETLTAADQAAIRALDSTFVDGWLRDDTAAVLSVFSPGAVLIPPGANPVEGLAAIRAYWFPSDGSHTRITSFDRAITEIAGTPRLAFLRGTATLGWTYTQGTQHSSQVSRSTDLLLFAPDSSGRWQVIRQMWGTRP